MNHSSANSGSPSLPPQTWSRARISCPPSPAASVGPGPKVCRRESGSSSTSFPKSLHETRGRACLAEDRGGPGTGGRGAALPPWGPWRSSHTPHSAGVRLSVRALPTAPPQSHRRIHWRRRRSGSAQTPPTRPAAAARTRAVRLSPEEGPGSEERRRENLPGGHSPGSVRGAPCAHFCSEGGNRGRTYVSALAAGWTKCALGMRGWVLRLGPKLHSTAPLGNKNDSAVPSACTLLS